MKKQNKFALFVVFTVSIFLFAGLGLYGKKVDSERLKIFNPMRANAAEKIYHEILERDLDSDYPKTVDDVMSFNNDIQKLYYGDMLTDIDCLEDFVKAQRLLYSDNLLEANDFQTQFDNLKESINELKDNDVFVISIDTGTPTYDPIDQTTCKVIVSQNTNALGSIDWEYNLIRDSSGRWKINSWQKAS